MVVIHPCCGRSVMRRSVRAAAVVLVSLGLVLAPALSASAARPKPPPVDAFPDLPKSLTRMVPGHPNGPSIGSPGIRVPKWARAQTAKIPGPSGSVVPAVKGAPITVPSPWAKVAAGSNALGWAFAGGFILGANGLELYGDLTGTDYDAAMCGLDPVLSFGYSLMSMGTGPACQTPIMDPNAGIPSGQVISYAGWSASHLGYRIQNNNGEERHCYVANGPLPSGFKLYVQGTGSWSETTFGYSTTAPAVCVGSGETGENFTTATTWLPGRTPNNGMPQPGRLQNATTGEVVAAFTALSGDPLRSSACTLGWPDGSTTSASVGTYRESEGYPIGAVSAACNDAYVSKPGAGPDFLPSTIGIDETNTESGAKTQIATQEVPDFTESEKVGLTPGDGTGLLLLKVVSGVVQSCMTWEASCVGWWPATEQGTQPAVGTDTYKCTYGGRDVDLTECGVYRYTFDVETSTPTLTDPATGEPFEWTSTATGTNSLSPAASLDPAGDCWAEWSAAPNPLEWVLQPIKCALVWAFVPRANVTNQALVDLGNAAGEVAVVDPLMTLLAELPAGGGCEGVPFNLTFFGESVNGHLLGACSGEGAAAAAVVSGLLTLSMVTATVLAMLRYLAALFGFVGPGGSMEQTERATALAVARSGKGSD